MKPLKYLVITLAILTLGSLTACGADRNLTTVRPSDTGTALVNPGMGWVLHFYDNGPDAYGSRLAYSDTADDYPGLSVVYLRIPWSYIEPQEGKFVWSVLDSPAQRWIAKGKQVAIRISCSESWMRYATPEWVKNAGAKGYDFNPGEGIVNNGPYWEPDFDDPVFLAKLDNFLTALGERYDANPEVAFVDVGSFGVWGEGHVYWSTKKQYPAATINKHIDLYRKHFRRTLLVANDDYAMQGEDTITHADKLGLTLRDDSILVDGGDRAYFHSNLAKRFWQRLPVILESQHYGMSKDAGIWGDGSKYLQAVEDYHASYISIHWWPREFLDANKDLVNAINLRLGYRVQLVEASWSNSAAAGSTLSFSAKWRNAGVAPCLPGGYPAITLKDSEGGIAAVLTDDSFDMRSLPVDSPGKAEYVSQTTELPLPFNLKPGKYDLFISVGTRTGTPKIALPLSGDDGAKRYRLGTLTVEAKQ